MTDVRQIVIDHNQTVWQRLRDAIRPHVETDAEAERFTRALHAYVIAERHDAARVVVERRQTR